MKHARQIFKFENYTNGHKEEWSVNWEMHRFSVALHGTYPVKRLTLLFLTIFSKTHLKILFKAI